MKKVLACLNIILFIKTNWFLTRVDKTVIQSWFLVLFLDSIRNICKRPLLSIFSPHKFTQICSWVLWTDSKEQFIHDSDIASWLRMISQDGAVVKLCLVLPYFSSSPALVRHPIRLTPPEEKSSDFWPT